MHIYEQKIQQEEDKFTKRPEETVSLPKKKKDVLAVKIREKENEEQRKKQDEQLAEKDDFVNPIERKLRLQKLVEEADMENAKELFTDKGIYTPFRAHVVMYITKASGS